ncbi:MAG: GDP-mannose 4,6-dehydratase, partial [Lutibacter sp.]|nr:GDP-mannose 4,6-dehydratase [Lutibacter sp.]
KGENITMYGDGMQTRSFQYVDDLVEGMVRMMNSDPQFLGPVNLGNPNEFSMLELAKSIIDLTGSDSKIIFMPLPKDDPKQRQPNIELAKEKLNGWEPKIQLKEGLEKTIAYFDKILKKS